MGPGSHQNVVPRLATHVPTMGVSAAFVRPKHARIKTELIPKSRVGLGSYQNLAPRLARLAPTMGLSAALVRSLSFMPCAGNAICVMFGRQHSVLTRVCRTGKTCANKDGANTKVTCWARSSPKPGSTPCTTCANDGTECCTRTLLIIYLFARFCLVLVMQ